MSRFIGKGWGSRLVAALYVLIRSGIPMLQHGLNEKCRPHHHSYFSPLNQKQPYRNSIVIEVLRWDATSIRVQDDLINLIVEISYGLARGG